MVLQSGVKANVNTGQINSLQKGEEVRAKLMNAIERKRNQEFASVQNAVRNMTQENQKEVIEYLRLYTNIARTLNENDNVNTINDLFNFYKARIRMRIFFKKSSQDNLVEHTPIFIVKSL